jgi:hypothetical protein
MTLVVGETLGPLSAVSQRGLIRDRGRMTGNSDCDLKAVGMIVWQGGN